jgi:hypothetical protein
MNMFRLRPTVEGELMKLWSLPEVTAVGPITATRGKLQLSKSMLREKSRMNRCLGKLWKLSSASSNEKKRNSATFDEWSDMEDSDNEEIRRRRGGGSVELKSQIARRKQEFTRTNIAMRTPELPGPKDLGWERPTWTTYQYVIVVTSSFHMASWTFIQTNTSMNMFRLRPTVEGELIKSAGTISALRGHQWDKPEWMHHSSLRATCKLTSENVKASSDDTIESLSQPRASERGYRKSVQCQVTAKLSTSVLSRSSSGSVSLNENEGSVMRDSFKLREHQPKESNSCEITVPTFDRKKVLRTTSRGERLFRGESIR